MHAFTDSPNWSHFDETECKYLDHYHFTLALLEWISVNPDIYLLLRFHPHSISYPTDSFFNQKIRVLASNFSNVNFLTSKVTIKSIYDGIPQEKLIPITGFGSVGLEFSYLGHLCFNYRQNIYTELGITQYFDEFSQLLIPAPPTHDASSLRRKAVQIEAIREYYKSQSLFTINNSNQTSSPNECFFNMFL